MGPGYMAHPLHALVCEVAHESPAVLVVEEQVLVLRIQLDDAAHSCVLVRQRPAQRGFVSGYMRNQGLQEDVPCWRAFGWQVSQARSGQARSGHGLGTNSQDVARESPSRVYHMQHPDGVWKRDMLLTRAIEDGRRMLQQLVPHSNQDGV